MLSHNEIPTLKSSANKILSKLDMPADSEEAKILNELLKLPEDLDLPKNHSAINQLRLLQDSFVDGNPQNVKVATTLLFGAGFTALFCNSNVVASTSLSEQNKSILFIAPSIAATLARFYLGYKVGENGGANFGRIFLYISLVGLIIGTCVYGLTDVTMVKSISSLQAVMLTLALALSGFGLGTISLVSNAMFWYKKNLSGYVSSFVGGYGGMFPGGYDGIFYLLNTSLGQTRGQITALCFLNLLLITKIGIFSKLKGRRVENAPSFQLREKYNLNNEEAIIFAKLLGQESFPNPEANHFFQNISKQFVKPKIIILIINYIVSFGLFLGMSTGLRLAVSAWGYQASFATLTAAVFSANSSLWRGVVGLILDKDPFGGGVTNSFGMLLVSASSAILVNNPDIVQSPEKLLPILIFLGGGLGLSCAALLKIVSSLAKSDKTINVPTANGLIAGLGPVGANIFTLGGGSLATRYPNNPGQGYIDILYIVIGLACMSGSLTFGLTLLDKFLSKRDTENNKKYQSVLFKEDNISECAEPKTVELTGSAELILLEEKPKEGDEIAGQFIAL